MYSNALCIVIVIKFNPIARSAPPLGCSVSHYKYLSWPVLSNCSLSLNMNKPKPFCRFEFGRSLGNIRFRWTPQFIYSSRCNITIWASIRGFRIVFIVNHKILAACIVSSLIGSLTHDHLFLSCQVSKASFGEKTHNHRVPTRDIRVLSLTVLLEHIVDI